MTHKLTEEQQRAAHKIIVANRGDCTKSDNYLDGTDCPWFCNECSCDISDYLPLEKFQAENLRRSQAWLDEHITDAEIMAESPREFCERMVRTRGNGRCKAFTNFHDTSTCKNCVLSTHKICNENLSFDRAKAFLASHATPQEPPKRRPTPDEMEIGATVRVRLWDEMVADGKLYTNEIINFPKNKISFVSEMKKYCGTTHKVIEHGILDGCGDWTFIPEMLDYVEPEKAVQPEPVEKAPTEKKKSEFIAKGKVDNLPLGLRFINFRDLLPVDGLRIVDLETKVKDLTKKLAESERKCDRLARRLRAKWEVARDSEMASKEKKYIFVSGFVLL